LEFKNENCTDTNYVIAYSVVNNMPAKKLAFIVKNLIIAMQNEAISHDVTHCLLVTIISAVLND